MSRILVASITELCGLDHGGDAARIAGWTANKTPGHVRAWLEGTGAILTLAEIEGGPVGVGGIDGRAAVLLAYVHPAHRFRGVSRALLADAETRLQATGANLARLTSTRTAHRFYLAAGWHDAGPPETAFGIVGLPMAKTLAAGD